MGSHGERITTRRLAVAAHRRSRYSGKPEYKLDDHALNRIDYTRWFEEACLRLHDASEPDPVCRRVAKSGRRCKSTPLQPSGLCIKHKAKLDWDRERQRQRLEQELQNRSPLPVPGRKPTVESPSTGVSSALPQYQEVASPAQLEGILDTATAMWGDVELFAMVAHGPRVQHPIDRGPAPLQRRTCFILIGVASGTILASLSIALWWSMTAHDVSGGFTMAGYIVALGGIIMYPIQSAHSRNCTCWRRPAGGRAR